MNTRQLKMTEEIHEVVYDELPHENQTFIDGLLIEGMTNTPLKDEQLEKLIELYEEHFGYYGDKDSDD